MDFGMATFENTSLSDFDEKTNNINPPKTHGSGFLSQKRSDPDPSDDQEPFFRSFKAARTDSFDPPNKTMSMRSDSVLSVPPGDGGSSNNMLSFSSSSAKNGNQSSLFSFYQPPPAYIRNAGYGAGGLQAGMHVPVSRYKGPFTPSQWMELEHQALIYKHIVANVPVPSHLLNPLRKSLNPFLFSGSSSSSYAPNSYGWGTFHLGFSGNTDPEPGRCRRTDGKKWRCSRDAVPDQKYCERHINRGRHRSRKPVEGQNGHAVSGPTATSKVGPIVSPTSLPISSNRASNNALGGMISSTETLMNRSQESQAFSMISPTISLKSKDDSFSVPKQHNPTQESSDSLLYTLQNTTYMHPTNCNSFLDKDTQNQNPLRHFIDEWPKDQSDCTSVTWPEELKADWTQLSMSIPMASSGFSSSSNSPAREKLTIAPHTLSQDFDLDPAHKQASNWVPISWANSMGGPLGEALKTSSSSGGKSKNMSSASELNHMTEMWDVGSYRLGSSPTGVLQKTTFVSLSNSSSGSSPRGKQTDGGGGEILL